MFPLNDKLYIISLLTLLSRNYKTNKIFMFYFYSRYPPSIILMSKYILPTADTNPNNNNSIYIF